MLKTAGDIRRHVGFKLASNEMRELVARRLLALLDTGADPDYPALLEAATFPDPPPLVYHTAPPYRRQQIRTGGLVVSQPGQGGSWVPNKEICTMLQGKQPPGVYVTGEPDRRGMWSHWPAWDVWEVQRGQLGWRHDRLNPGCWSLTVDVPARCVRLVGTFGGGS